MGPYLSVPKKEKESMDGENAKVTPIPFNLYPNSISFSLSMVPQACKAGGTLWKIPI